MRPTNSNSTARESARRTDGRFGVQPRQEADGVALTAAQALTARPADAVIRVVEEVEEIHGQWRGDLRCAELVAALDRDAEQHGYDTVRVVKLGLQMTENTDGTGRPEARRITSPVSLPSAPGSRSHARPPAPAKTAPRHAATWPDLDPADTGRLDRLLASSV